jgi:hypothetical protein
LQQRFAWENSGLVIPAADRAALSLRPIENELSEVGGTVSDEDVATGLTGD